MESEEKSRLFTTARRADHLARASSADFTTLPTPAKFEMIRVLKANVGSIAFWDPIQQKIVVRTDQGLQFIADGC